MGEYVVIDGNVLELNGVSNHLWKSANIQQAPVDATDFKMYIFPLLFFKRTTEGDKNG